MARAAMRGQGVALAPPLLFARALAAGDLVQPFPLAVDMGGYWLTRLMSRADSPAMADLRAWLAAAVQAG